MNVSDRFLKLYDIIRTLRSPDGCSWDREQTPESLRGALLEETYEVIEAIDSGDLEHVREELGDVYLIVTMLGVIFEEAGSFSVAESLSIIVEKLVRRHPHVFGDSVVESPDEIIDQWNRIKVEEEGKRPKDRWLDSVSKALPSLERAYKLQKKAAKTGFDWPDISGVVAKLHEEIAEVQSELSAPQPDTIAIEEEVGDLLFSAVNVSRFLGVDPSLALHRANQKFSSRFGTVESQLKQRGSSLESASLDDMEEIWNSLR
jgi:nucleoside triphosphate diphosphatase